MCACEDDWPNIAVENNVNILQFVSKLNIAELSTYMYMYSHLQVSRTLKPPYNDEVLLV